MMLSRSAGVIAVPVNGGSNLLAHAHSFLVSRHLLSCGASLGHAEGATTER
jgi:hypothetical protein